MEKDLVFFGEGGITATEANRIANMAKLAYTEDESALGSISFVNESVETISGSMAKDIAYGTKSLKGVEERLERMGNLKALCAWLREAIKAQERLIKEAKTYPFVDYVRNNNIELPKAPSPVVQLTEDDVIATFDIKKRNRYYYLEAMASAIGDFIHKNMPLDLARKKFYDVISHPRRLVGTGQDTLIYSYSTSIGKEELENTFSELQQKHSSYQKELNSIKSEILSRISNDNIDKTREYEDSIKEYNNKLSEIQSGYSKWMAENQKKMTSLKIIIPNSLKTIYDEIANLGKKQ